MSITLAQLPILTGTLNAGLHHFDAHDEDWNLDSGTGGRVYRKRVVFPAPFAALPVVHVALKSFDLITGANHRLSAEVEDTDARGFTVAFVTWYDTLVYGVGVNWIAFGEISVP